MDKNLPRYRQERLLGEGGMGQVHLAIDSHLHRQVAIKTLRQQSTDTKVDLALKEARVLARVNHSNIIQIFNIEEQEQHIALVMEYFNSKTLTQYQHENQITLIQKLSLLRQLAAGLAEAHKNGIVHCDLKPSNILVNNDGHLKIADFGIACLTNKQSDDTQSKEVEQALEQYKNSFGCVRYMSPEQLNQQTVDFRSDIFSFGIIAYQLIVGSHPFGSGAANKVAENIINSEPEHVENLLLDAPDALTSLIMAMLTKVMDKRTLTAADIAHRVKHIENALLQQQIAQEQTTDITSIYNPSLSTESSVKASTTNAQIKALATEKIKQGIMQAKYVLSFCILLTVLFSLLLTNSPKETESKQVVVLRPVVSHSQAMAPMQQNLVVSAVEDALRQAVINTKSMYLISQREVAAITKAYPNNLKKLQQAVGASDIISTELECNSSRCNVKFARLVANPKSENALIAKFEKSWLVPVQRFNEIYSVSQTQFSSLYPEYNDVNQSGLVQRPISEDDYRNYIELYSEIKLTGNYQGSSLEKLEKILQRSPYLYAGYALYRDTALDLYLDSKNQKYLNQLEMVIQSSPPEYRYSIYEAIDRFWLYSDKGELDAAIAQIAEAKKRGADGLSVLELEAYIFFISGRYEQAAKSYLRAFELRPSSSLQYNIAFSYWRAGDLSSAERTVGAMLETVADNRRAMQLQANIWLLQGKLSLAISTYEKIVKNVDSSRDFTNLSLAYALNKQYDKSKEYAQKAFELFPMQPVNLLNLADIEMILGQKELAKSHYQQVVSILVGKNEVKYLTNLAQAYGHLKQASKAVESLNRAQVLAPNSGEVAYASAIVYSLLNEKASAIHHVKAALINNTGSVLFNLPWFDALCNEQLFQQLMTDYDNASRCSV